MRTRDAEILYVGAIPTFYNDNETIIKDEQLQYCTVLEILKDETPSRRIGSPSDSDHTTTTSESFNAAPFAFRQSKWCPLIPYPSTQPTHYVPAFETIGNEKGLALERVRGVLGEKTGTADTGLGRQGEDGIAGAERLTGRGVSNIAKIYGFGGRRV